MSPVPERRGLSPVQRTGHNPSGVAPAVTRTAAPASPAGAGGTGAEPGTPTPQQVQPPEPTRGQDCRELGPFGPRAGGWSPGY